VENKDQDHTGAVKLIPEARRVAIEMALRERRSMTNMINVLILREGGAWPLELIPGGRAYGGKKRGRGDPPIAA
jgi:hypothetical protein